MLASAAEGVPPRVRTWTGEEWGPDSSPATLVLRHPGAFRALLIPPTDLTAAEAYIYDDVDLEGDLVATLNWAAGLESMGAVDRLRILGLARRLPDGLRRHERGRPRLWGRLHSLRRDRRAVTHHYDTGNEFFSLFLDPRMSIRVPTSSTPPNLSRSPRNASSISSAANSDWKKACASSTLAVDGALWWSMPPATTAWTRPESR